MVEKRAVYPQDHDAPFGVWTPAIVTGPGRLAFLSGATSRDKGWEVVGAGDIAVQTRQVCENLKASIEACGGTLADIVSVTVFVTDIELFDEIHAVRREYFPDDPPTSTMVEVSRMVDPRSMIEISAIAVLN
jgi:2-iminobutanoate/2-iminopropanoate deaminase